MRRYLVLIFGLFLGITLQGQRLFKMTSESHGTIEDKSPKCDNRSSPFTLDYDNIISFIPKTNKVSVKIQSIEISNSFGKQPIKIIDPIFFQGNPEDTILFSMRKLIDFKLIPINYFVVNNEYFLVITVINGKDVCKTYYRYEHNEKYKYLTILFKDRKVESNIGKDYADYIYPNDSIHIIPKGSIQSINVKLIINPLSTPDYFKEVPLDLLPSGSSYNISIKKLLKANKISSQDLQSGDYIKFEILSLSDTALISFIYSQVGTLEIANFKFYSPILYRADGNLKDFGFKDFAPSFGYGVYKFEFKNKLIRNIGLNLLGTVMQTVVDTVNSQNNRYSLGLGSYVDIGGIISIGGIYLFKDERPYFIIGFRIEELRRLFNKK